MQWWKDNTPKQVFAEAVCSQPDKFERNNSLVRTGSSLNRIVKLYHYQCWHQGLVKGAILCFRNPYFYFQLGESTSTASQLTSPASQKSKDLNKVPVYQTLIPSL